MVPDSFKLSSDDSMTCYLLQCHPTLPVLATSGIEHTIKLWSPDGAAAAVDPVSCALRTRKNQERIMSGPQMLRSISPRVFQVSDKSVLFTIGTSSTTLLSIVCVSPTLFMHAVLNRVVIVMGLESRLTSF